MIIHRIVTRIKIALYRPIGMFKTYLSTKRRKKMRGSQSRLFVLNVPSHGNLGDHLLSVAEQLFLKENFPNYQIVLIPSSALFFSIRLSLFDVNSSDILCITGGGFMGSMYEDEKRILSIVRKFPNNKIVFFPQTFYYESNEKGEKLMEQARTIYSHHNHLYVTVRDDASYELLTTKLMPEFKHRVFLTPDIALYAHFPQSASRSGVLWCLRNDSEKLTSNALIIQSIHKIINRISLTERNTDTYVDYPISVDNEYAEVEKKIIEISQSQLVITDRLHGMIYCIITHTPVIVLDNINHKVSHVYELWLKHIPFVKFVTDKSRLEDIVHEMLCFRNVSYDYEELKNKYRPLIDAINE